MRADGMTSRPAGWDRQAEDRQRDATGARTRQAKSG